MAVSVSGQVQAPFCLAPKPEHEGAWGVSPARACACLCVPLFPAQCESCPSWVWPSPE